MIYLILLLALALRLINLNQSLWWDEVINVTAAFNSGFLSYVGGYTLVDFHPPGYFALLWVWIKLFGTSEVIVRLPSVLFALGTVWLTYLIGTKLVSKKVGIVASLLLALAPLHIYYSQEARMYSFASFATALSMYFFFSLMENRKKAFVGYLLGSTLVLYSDYVAYFIFPAQLFYCLFFKRSLLKKVMLALFGSTILFIPWLILLPKQVGIGLSTAENIKGWKKVVGGHGMKEVGLLVVKTLVGRISFPDKVIYGLLVGTAGLLFGLPILKSLPKLITGINLMLIFWLVLPPVLAFLVSFQIPVFSYFRFIFILPAFYLLAAVSLDRLKRETGIIFLCLVVIMEAVFSFTYLFNPAFHREDWKGAVAYIDQESGPDTKTFFKYHQIPASYSYYGNDRLNVMPALKSIPAKSEDNLNSSLLEFQRGKIILVDYLTDITDPGKILEKFVLGKGCNETEKRDFRGVGFIITYNCKN